MTRHKNETPDPNLGNLLDVTLLGQTTQIQNFSINNAKSTNLTAINSSQTEALDTRPGRADIMIINLSKTEIVFVATGNENVVASANSMPVLPGEKGVYSKGADNITINTLAYFSPTGSVDFTIVQAEGS